MLKCVWRRHPKHSRICCHACGGSFKRGVQNANIAIESEIGANYDAHAFSGGTHAHWKKQKNWK